MKLVRNITVAAFAFVLAFIVVSGPAPASASTIEECQSSIAGLREATLNATFTGQNPEKDLEGLLGKLEAADAALLAGKNVGAVQKLTDFRTRVEQLNAQGKIDPTDAAALIAGANEAIVCIETIETAP